MLSFKCLCFCTYLCAIWRILITQRNCSLFYLFFIFMTAIFLHSAATVCAIYVCFWLKYFRCAFCCKICVCVCAHACEANGELLSGQRWIWGSLGPWSVQAFTLTPSMWAWACALCRGVNGMWCVFACQRACSFYSINVTTFLSCRHPSNVF